MQDKALEVPPDQELVDASKKSLDIFKDQHYLQADRMTKLQYLKLIFDLLDDDRKRRIIDRLDFNEDEIVRQFNELIAKQGGG